MAGGATQEVKSQAPGPFLDLNPNPAIALNRDGAVSYANAAARACFPGIAQCGGAHPVLMGLDRLLPALEGKSHELVVFAREVPHGGLVYDQQILSTPADGHVYVYMTDITARRRTEHELREAHVRLEERVQERTALLAETNASLTREIARREEVQRMMQEARDAAVRADMAKSEFLAVMSHELRTPLNGVIGMTELLLGTQLNSEQRHLAQTAKFSADALLRLISDILDFSKIEAGKLDLECAEFDLRSCVEKVITVFASVAVAKGVKLSHRIDPRVPERVRGDSLRLQQIISNLVGNALKFTHQGEVSVSVDPEESDADKAVLAFRVRDTGDGIPSDRIQALFRPFSQIDASTTRKYGGTGLGLAICKHLAEIMGGQIGVESEYGKGSTFRFTIKFETPTPPPPCNAVGESNSPSRRPADSAPDPGRSPRKTRVLVAEDDVVSKEVAMGILTRAGYECAVAGDGRKVVEIALREEWDIVLMDCSMPRLDGFAATRLIREAEREGRAPWQAKRGRLPIIALTASASREVRERCFAAGMDDYIPKPFEVERLLQMVETHLARLAAQL